MARSLVTPKRRAVPPHTPRRLRYKAHKPRGTAASRRQRTVKAVSMLSLIVLTIMIARRLTTVLPHKNRDLS